MNTAATIGQQQVVSALAQPHFGRLPLSETFGRRYYGRNLDLVQIEAAILMAQGQGIMAPLADLGRETLRNDLHASACVQKRIGAVASAPWDLTAAQGVEEELAKQCAHATRAAIRGCRGFYQGIKDLAWAIFDGRGALEVDWQPLDGRSMRAGSFGGFATPHVTPRSFEWIHPGRLSFGPQRELRVVERHRQTSFYFAVGEALEKYARGKFVWWTPRNFSDYPEREGLLPRLLYWCFFKRFSWRYRMILTELFGLPWRIIERDPTWKPAADVQNSDALDDDVESAEALGGTSVAALSPGAKLRVERPDPESHSFFGMTSGEVDAQVSRLVNGQSATKEGDANRASAVVATKDEDVVREDDGRGLEQSVQELFVNAFVEANWGPPALPYAPTFTIRTSPPRDQKGELERVGLVLDMGLAVATSQIYEISGLRQPRDGEGLVRRSASGGAPGAAAAPPASQEGNAPGSAQQLVERVLDGLEGDLEHEPEDGEDDAELSRVVLAASAGHYTPHGSPEALIERGAKDGARLTSRWCAQLVAAVEGRTDPRAVHRALVVAARAVDLEGLARSFERRIVHGAMLGALDADWEGAGGGAVTPSAFARVALKGGPDEAEDVEPSGDDEPAAAPPAPEPAERLKDFSTKPFGEAISAFASKRVLPKREFERLHGAAKKRAFTVAGLAQQSMLAVAHDELTKAITEGDDLRTFRARLGQRFDDAGWTKLNPSHVETVFRNGVMGAYAAGRTAQMTQPAVLAARPFWQCLGVDDSRTRPTHRALHGKAMTAAEAQARPMPWGHNCFVPSTLIRGEIVGASRALYAGKAVELTTREGRRLVVTANHPVLSAHGLVEAQKLTVGDKVVCYGFESTARSDAPPRPKIGEYDEPRSAEEVFRALAHATPRRAARVGADDFHGEARRFIGEIEVVGSYVGLGAHVAAAGAEEFSQLDLVSPHVGQVAGSRFGGGYPLFERPRASSHSGVSRGDLAIGGNGVEAQALPLLRFGLGLAAQFHPALLEATTKRIAGDAQLVRELLEGGAGAVALDELIDVRLFDFAGHVYDFETVQGWLVADGVLASNCRCRYVSRSARDIERLNLEVIGGAQVTGVPDEGWDASDSILEPGGAPPRPAPAPAPRAPRPAPPPVPAPAPPPPPTAAPPAPAYGPEHTGRAAVDAVAQATARVFPSGAPSVAQLQEAWGGASVEARVAKVVTRGANNLEFLGSLYQGDKHVGRFVRSFSRTTDDVLVVTHDFFVLSKAAQGAGAGAAMMKGSLELYRDLGVASVELQAEWIGKYTWARLGFDWSAEEAASRATSFSAFLAQHGVKRSAAELAGITKHPWMVAEYDDGQKVPVTYRDADGVTQKGEFPLGKAFLLTGQGWHGVLSLAPDSPSAKYVAKKLSRKEARRGR